MAESWSSKRSIGSSCPPKPVVGPNVREGRLGGLAVSGNRRTASVPNVPKVAEAGVPGFDASFYETLWAPRGTPQAHIDRLQQEVAQALNSAETRSRLAATDLEPLASTPAEAGRLAKADSAKWAEVQKKVNLQLD
jgi:tripartite-type tricarboxylate transporter receptor subunit TctC